ncbi:MAG: MFS transporter [Proteobacteria bacterium]|nr:MFS transporter [Pseudomonadota bacterium]
MTDAVAPAFGGHGTKSYRGYALLMLTVVYTFNFVDRGLIGIAQEPLKLDLGVDDFQLGLLGGPAFAILYTLLGVPIARMAERSNRITIITVGAAVWSFMTAACGLAGSYMQLVIARVGVGIGEAACTPPSQSVLTDYFPSARRATALAIYALGIPIGTMISAYVGSQLVAHGGEWFAWLEPTFRALGLHNNAEGGGAVAGWRTVFLALGFPGLIAALILKATVREPPRSGLTSETPSFSATLRAIGGKASFWHIAIAGALMSFVGYSTSQFLVSYLVRNYSVSIQQAAGALAIVAGISVAIGTFAGGFVSDRLQRRFPAIAAWLPGAGILVALPVYLFAFAAPNFNTAFMFLLVAPMFHYLYLGPMYAVSQSIVEPRMRATTVAILLLIVNLIGYGLGPPALGALSDFLANRELASTGLTVALCKAPGVEHPAACAPALAHGLRYAMMGVTCLLAWPMIHFFLASRRYLADRVS